METIEGAIEFIVHPKVFKNSVEWAVLQIKTDHHGRLKAVGEIMQCKRGDVFKFHGHFERSKFGEEFKFERASRSDTGEAGSFSYLSHLFGPKTAQKIAKHFGTAEEALKVFKEDRDLITDIKGISHKTVKKAVLKHQDHQVVEVLFTQLKPCGMTMHLALKIYKRYGNTATDIIKDNPYKLIDDFENVGFQLCDSIADFYGLSLTDPRRLKAGIFQTMKHGLTQGHVYLLFDQLQKKSIELLSEKGSINPTFVQHQLADLIRKGELKEEVGQKIYIPAYFTYEKETAIQLLRLNVKTIHQSDDVILDKIEEFEWRNNIQFAHQQGEAIFNAVKNQFAVVTGPPGSGKTTVIDAIIYVLQQLNPQVPLDIGLAAPTGKAAKRMSEATGLPAQTIHKLLNYRPDGAHWEFEFNQHNPLKKNLLIIDEFSMMDLPMTYHLLKAVPKGCTVLFVGDKDQLPSVGPGQVLADILSSGVFPVTILDEVYRQKKGSTIFERAHAVSKGRIPELKATTDFEFISHDDLLTLQEMMLTKFYASVKAYGLDDVVVLAPMRKGPLGVEELNRVIQSEINPPARYKREVKFGRSIYRERDKVIQMRPNETEGLVNGQIGYIDAYIPEDPANGEEEQLIVDYEGEKVIYPRDRFDEIALAYALSIHKSQGSEWKAVFIPISAEHRFMLKRRLIYTAMTRAKEYLGMFGDVEEFKRGILYNREYPRNSVLTDRIKGVA